MQQQRMENERETDRLQGHMFLYGLKLTFWLSPAGHESMERNILSNLS